MVFYERPIIISYFESPYKNIRTCTPRICLRAAYYMSTYRTCMQSIYKIISFSFLPEAHRVHVVLQDTFLG